MAQVSLGEMWPLCPFVARGTKHETRGLNLDLFVRLLDNVFGLGRLIGAIDHNTPGVQQAWDSIGNKVNGLVRADEFMAWMGRVEFRAVHE